MRSRVPASRPSSALARAAISGGAATLLSVVALMRQSRRDTATPWTGINAVSHWFHGDAALRRHSLSGRYTAPGLVLHTLSSLLWAGLHRLVLGAVRRPGAPFAVVPLIRYTSSREVMGAHASPKAVTAVAAALAATVVALNATLLWRLVA